MKNLLLLLIVCAGLSANAQLCKNAKTGMGTDELIKAVGLPDSTKVLGTENVTDTMFVWFYGNQQAMIFHGKVERLIMDPKKESELARQVSEGSLKADDFERQIEELNENSCK
jgi:hypothetical protein